MAGTSSGGTSSGGASSGGASSGGGSSGGADAGRPACGPVEICGNGLDDDCNDLAEDGCLCDPGETLPCYDGPPAQAGVGVCVIRALRI